MNLSDTGTIEVQSDQACVVYDAQTGRIHHVHRVVTLRGGAEPPQDTIEARALELAAKKGRNVSQLKTLMVPPERLHPGATHKVDPDTSSLVSEPIRDETFTR
jgi:hypothetical protein